MEVIRPQHRAEMEVFDFLRTNAAWIVLVVIERGRVLVEHSKTVSELAQANCSVLNPTSVGIEEEPRRAGANRIGYDPGRLIIFLSPASATAPAKSLENWLRKRARMEIMNYLGVVTSRLETRTAGVPSWTAHQMGNCSSLKNLSFNWRLIMAPDFVLRYLVTHEAVHPGLRSSQKFWLTVRSLCPESECAKQWLCANGQKLLVDLNEVCGRDSVNN